MAGAGKVVDHLRVQRPRFQLAPLLRLQRRLRRQPQQEQIRHLRPGSPRAASPRATSSVKPWGETGTVQVFQDSVVFDNPVEAYKNAWLVCDQGGAEKIA